MRDHFMIVDGRTEPKAGTRGLYNVSIVMYTKQVMPFYPSARGFVGSNGDGKWANEQIAALWRTPLPHSSVLYMRNVRRALATAVSDPPYSKK